MSKYICSYVQEFVCNYLVIVMANSYDEAEDKFKDYLLSQETIGIIIDEFITIDDLSSIDTIE